MWFAAALQFAFPWLLTFCVRRKVLNITLVPLIFLSFGLASNFAFFLLSFACKLVELVLDTCPEDDETGKRGSFFFCRRIIAVWQAFFARLCEQCHLKSLCSTKTLPHFHCSMQKRSPPTAHLSKRCRQLLCKVWCTVSNLSSNIV